MKNKEGNYANWILDCDCYLTTDCTLGTSDYKLTDFKVYPNPAQNLFYIDTPIELKAVEMYDLQGRKVKRFSKVQEHYSISELISGLYFLKIQIESGENFTKKLIVE